MSYKFPLAVVLRLRKNLEEKELREVERLQLEISRIMNAIESAENQKQQIIVVRQGQLQNGLSASELHGLCVMEKDLDNYKKLMLERLKEARGRWETQLAIYREKKLAREILSELAAQKKEVYDQQALSAEQKRIDDMFTTRNRR